ncbi:hypothetical protein B0H11DRAFT_1192788 [Mycena galericulata]|nr:hypothetical protein B0H11DRAFT_1192788 [Mycena galericulata]
MSYIPFDILMEILPLVDFPDLPAMALTNKGLSTYALDRMYRHIVSKNMKGACESVASNLSLARRVKSLEINRSIHGAHLQYILPALRDALQNTLNLRTLKLDIDGHHSWVLEHALGAFKLHSFSSLGYTDEHLIDFLHDQIELEEIRLMHSFIQYRSPLPWIFPKLQKFEGPMSWIEEIVPRQPVSHIVVSQIVSHGANISALGLTTAPIRHLQIPFHAVDKRSHGELKTLFPAVVDLAFTIDDSWPTRNNPDMAMWLQDLLATLSTVENVCLLGRFDLLSDEDDTKSFVHKVTARAPGVRRFNLEIRRRGTWPRMVYWTRIDSGWEVATVINAPNLLSLT